MAVDFEVSDGIGEVVINNPPVNALSSSGWFEFAENMEKHLGTKPYSRLGLRSALRTDPVELLRALVTLSPVPRAVLRPYLENPWLTLLGFQLGFIALFCLAAWRASLFESSVLSLGLVFALTPVGSYYWIILLALPLLPGRIAPLAPILLAVLVYGHEVYSGALPTEKLRLFALSWGLALFFTIWLGRRAVQVIFVTEQGDRRWRKRPE